MLVVSQNPQFPPAAGVSTHRARQAAQRIWALDTGYDYVPVFEAFTAEPDGGQSLVSADGVHTTTAGSTFWADVVTAAI